MPTIISTNMRWVLVGIIALVLITLGVFIGRKTSSSSVIADQSTKAPVVISHQNINKSFSFPVTSNQGQFVTNISYTITSVDTQDQIIIKGQRASAVGGRTFLIVNLKLTNSSSENIELNSRDYIRISVGKSTELLAADLYNDPIVIQPISTQYTRLGFPIDSSEKKVNLHVGQLSGPKTDISVTLK